VLVAREQAVAPDRVVGEVLLAVGKSGDGRAVGDVLAIGAWSPAGVSHKSPWCLVQVIEGVRRIPRRGHAMNRFADGGDGRRAMAVETRR
jgi:hypothetical protein